MKIKKNMNMRRKIYESPEMEVLNQSFEIATIICASINGSTADDYNVEDFDWGANGYN